MPVHAPPVATRAMHVFVAKSQYAPFTHDSVVDELHVAPIAPCGVHACVVVSQ